jgi:hypothetical protein
MTVTEPILAGFYPDPSICRVEDTYYVISSSFEYLPGQRNASTGSYPEVPHGAQRNNRHNPISDPCAIPRWRIAWKQYSLHVGVWRHAGGNTALT